MIPQTRYTRLNILRGDTASWEFRIAEQNGGAALDLTGASLRFTVKTSRREPDSAALIQKQIATGIEVVDALGGVLRVTLSAADTAALDPQTLYVWDLQVRTALGIVITPDYAQGTMRIDGDVTRTTQA